jgi:Na+-transporting NADH:ubiquinone oxidoreductase subunit NqrC
LKKTKKVAGYLVRNDMTSGKSAKEISEMISEIVNSKLQDEEEDEEEEEEDSQNTTEIKEDDDDDDEDFIKHRLIVDDIAEIVHDARKKMSSDVKKIGRFGLCQALFGGIIGGSLVLSGFVAGHLFSTDQIFEFLPFNCSF